MPAVMGHEISGTVAALGPGVVRATGGHRVVSAFIMPCGTCVALRRRARRSVRQLLRQEPAEGHALRRHHAAAPPRRLADCDVLDGRPRRVRVVPATDVFPLADGLPLEESSVLGCAVFTAYGAVRHGAELRGGERIAVVAAGGVGINIIQIAAPSAPRRSSRWTCATTSSKRRAAWAPPTSSTRQRRRRGACARADRRPRRRRRLRGARPPADRSCRPSR